MTAMAANRVLVFPRAIFDEEFSLLPWDSIQEKIAEIESSFSWLARHTAEQSKELVQAIPCAFIRDSNGRFCVLRRVQTPRKDLSKKLSLVVGGHIDNSRDHNTFQASMYSNLMRELEEEVGIGATENPLRPVGVIIDDSSIQASRHIAFVHEIQADNVWPKAREEFVVDNSKYSGTFMDASELAERRDQFDPWSRLLIEEYICPDAVQPQPRQFSFL